jgi:DNA-binding PadR family transcriptional regulator
MFIVSDTPKTGAEIMDIMETNLQGWWRPSPGSIYPLLKQLVDEGVLSRSKDDKYSLTPAGREEVNHPWPPFGMRGPAPRSAEGALEVISSYTSYLEDLSRSKDPKLAQNTKLIRELANRLSKLGEDS